MISEYAFALPPFLPALGPDTVSQDKDDKLAGGKNVKYLLIWYFSYRFQAISLAAIVPHGRGHNVITGHNLYRQSHPIWVHTRTYCGLVRRSRNLLSFCIDPSSLPK